MAASATVEVFKDLTNLAADALGTFVLYATDDYFAEKENLLKPSAPEWAEGRYTDKGKWMDGWESQRRRSGGHDFCLVRLGAPGEVLGALVDTTHFKGNAPQHVQLEGIEAPHTATATELNESDRWFEILPKAAVAPDALNALQAAAPSPRCTHVRLRIFPDGGVARLRVYGRALPDKWVFRRPGSVDLAAAENGGRVVAVSDQFFGPPSNLLLPGRGANMGDGWETKRRRTEGSDWCVIALGRRGVVQRIELDTHFFKGNAPQATRLEGLDARGLDEKALGERLKSAAGWRTLIDDAPLVQHRRHLLEPGRRAPLTHVRVHIIPHGGVNRLRLWGVAEDLPSEAARLKRLNAQKGKAPGELFLSFCGARNFARAMDKARPFASTRELFEAADHALASLSRADWLQAFQAHPVIGEAKAAPAQTKASGQWSQHEQAQVKNASELTREKLRLLNGKYYDKFGFIFICFATGRSAEQMLQLLERRVQRTREEELETAALEQAAITRLRIDKWLEGR